MNKIEVLSNAKINLGLNVYDKCEDGYHNIDTIMLPITIHDKLFIEFFEEKGNLEIECSDSKIPTDERNILYKTYKIFYEKLEKEGDKIKVFLKKVIPSEAGLGGGSSNSATFLKTLNEYNNNHFSKEELIQIAMEIGSDVPFFIENKALRVSKKGEQIKIVENNLETYLAIIKPEFGVSTKEAYEEFDRLKDKKIADLDEIEKALKENNLPLLEKNIENCLEYAIIEKKTEIQLFKNILNSVFPSKKFYMSGSGSAYYTFISEKEKDIFEVRVKTFVDNIKVFICSLKK